MDIVLIVNNLKKYFGSTKAVDGLSFNVKSGEIYGLLGPNGAGKSTTIKSILGLLEINSGNISVFGDDPIKNPTRVKKNI
ncbi:MAG: ATP-binding cassette domain-containing protein, partial [Candidatus Hodarchaeota archaeon]